MKLDTLSDEELYELFELKYGSPESTGWAPRRRLRWGYYHPADKYESFITRLVTPSTRWLDVGGGRALFPENDKLSSKLAERCKKLVAIDPSENVWENPYATEKYQCMFEDFDTTEKFDLATFRMVAEHIQEPEEVVKKLNGLLSDDGCVVIYTINRFSPIPLVTYLTPFALHYKVKKFFWGGEEKDTFPVAYKMNTRKALKTLFESHGFREAAFHHLDDLSAFAAFKSLNLVELTVWKGFKLLGLTYPENNLLGVYKKQ